MSFSFHPEAEQEFNEAINYYEHLEEGLGYDFALEVHSAVKRSIEFPKAWPELEDNIRRSLVRRFPYGILYSEEQDGIFIVAVMNLHRMPGYWKQRE
ncbi:type II toxin-antitoxin system RelE/ParE family toxin [Lacimicrobium alkaliphilum]|uniref:Toxin, RelE family protein n=1 Tax=Lacimicrobium alkaliphilum TaxID=1526571 RepID=A0ABQ1QZ35_9ALTE|nr:type II toxin-antitoxin system RelE/ParE family toxin [Lacimicrobium alkaliphilum]GGD49081.1 toxin, RelE family protein [Lacimicrobium alkaliphilum]